MKDQEKAEVQCKLFRSKNAVSISSKFLSELT